MTVIGVLALVALPGLTIRGLAWLLNALDELDATEPKAQHH